MSGKGLPPPTVVSDLELTDDSEALVGGKNGLEMTLALSVIGFEIIASTAVMPRMRDFARDHARLGRVALARHGNGYMETLDAEVARQKAER